ncbi:porin family protein [Seramator thermalis]|jgi:hypothetical protein|uniref:porin family protein n=1 Tax=Seramator thermalis TaxID=2496270 RepID=UPI00101BDE14|nr:porin family protein [Seramator thermalis]
MSKITSLVIILTLFLNISAKSQSVYVGIKGGGSFTRLTSNDLSDLSGKFGGMGALTVDYEFISNMSVQTGAYFFMKGATYSTTSGDQQSVPVDADMYYLQFPLHFSYKIPISGSVRFNVNAGPYVAVGIAGKTKVGSGDNVVKYDTFSGAGDVNAAGIGFRNFDGGIGLGAGLEFNSFTIDAGWDFGLANISRIDGTSVKTQNGYVAIGFNF